MSQLDTRWHSSASKLTCILGLTFIGVTWNLVLPGCIAYVDNVFDKRQVELKLPKTNQRVVQYSKYLHQREEASARVQLIENLIERELNGAISNSRIDSLLVTRAHYLEILDNRSPIQIVGFFEARAPYYLLFSTFALALHVLAIPHTQFTAKQLRLFFGFSVVAQVLWMGPNWARNFIFYNEERVVYSHVHCDISRLCFLNQEMQLLAICFLVGWSWSQWTVLGDAIANQLKSWNMTANDFDIVLDRSCYVGRVADLWQIHSVMLAFAFLPWTLFYWKISIQYGDVRYYSSAFACHALWGISWWLISIPAVASLKWWTLYQRTAIASARANNTSGMDLSKYVSETTPVSYARTLVVGTASVIAFALPLLNLVI